MPAMEQYAPADGDALAGQRVGTGIYSGRPLAAAAAPAMPGELREAGKEMGKAPQNVRTIANRAFYKRDGQWSIRPSRKSRERRSDQAVQRPVFELAGAAAASVLSSMNRCW